MERHCGKVPLVKSVVMTREGKENPTQTLGILIYIFCTKDIMTGGGRRAIVTQGENAMLYNYDS